MDADRLGTRISIDPGSRIPTVRAAPRPAGPDGGLRPPPTGRAPAHGARSRPDPAAVQRDGCAGLPRARLRRDHRRPRPRGTFVADAPPNAYSTIEQKRHLDEAARAYAVTVRQLDVDDDAAVGAVLEALADPPPARP